MKLPCIISKKSQYRSQKTGHESQINGIVLFDHRFKYGCGSYQTPSFATP